MSSFFSSKFLTSAWLIWLFFILYMGALTYGWLVSLVTLREIGAFLGLPNELRLITGTSDPPSLPIFVKLAGPADTLVICYFDCSLIKTSKGLKAACPEFRLLDTSPFSSSWSLLKKPAAVISCSESLSESRPAILKGLMKLFCCWLS